jgi:hypothetical protein
MKRLTEAAALARLRREKSAFQTDIKLNYERAALPCKSCPTPGACCIDAHFVNVHITRLEAVAIRDTLSRTPRLDTAARRAVYVRARETVARYHLSASGDTFAQTYSCPLFVKDVGCLVHARAKPAPCVQHACYERWEDVPPAELQWREESRIERLNEQAYGAAWAWLPLPVWLTLVDPDGDGAQLSRLITLWSSRRHVPIHPARLATRRSLPVVAF